MPAGPAEWRWLLIDFSYAAVCRSAHRRAISTRGAELVLHAVVSRQRFSACFQAHPSTLTVSSSSGTKTAPFL
jgi:hypothetical protein